jgi:hypothetical protein
VLFKRKTRESTKNMARVVSRDLIDRSVTSRRNPEGDDKIWVSLSSKPPPGDVADDRPPPIFAKEELLKRSCPASTAQTTTDGVPALSKRVCCVEVEVEIPQGRS